MSAEAGWRLCIGGPSVGGLVGRRHQLLEAARQQGGIVGVAVVREEGVVAI